MGGHVGTSPYVGTCRGKSGLGFRLAGFSPNVGTCRGKSGLEFRVFRRAAARPYVRGFPVCL